MSHVRLPARFRRMLQNLMPGTFIAGSVLCVSLMSAHAIAAEGAGARVLYTEHCAACHGGDRLGAIGPALLPESLVRLKKAAAVDVIRHGRAATQMPGFADRISAAEAQDLADYLYTPPAELPPWGATEIRASHIRYRALDALPASPQFTADPLNLFTVVEAGDHHVTILDGDRLEPLARFPSRFALHGGAKYSPDGRFVYLMSRDGWVSQYDLYSLSLVAEIRAGLNSRNIAVSADGRFVAAGNMLPNTLVLLDARDLSLLKVIPVVGSQNKIPSRVSAVYTAPPRKSFIVALKDVPEMWEIATDENARPVYSGLVHSYEKGQEEAVGVEGGLFAVRRMVLDDYLDDFFFDPPYKHAIGASRDGSKGQVVNLVVGRRIAEVDLPGMPHLGSGITWQWQGTRVMATPHLKEAAVSIIDMAQWKTLKRLNTLGPGFFMRSHENTPYVWTDASLSPRRDTLQIIDKNSLEIVHTVTPQPGVTASHVEFDRYGRYALVSLPEMDGALVIYDAATFQEIKRLPMRKPSGKYNVYNKTRYSEGTSH